MTVRRTRTVSADSGMERNMLSDLVLLMSQGADAEKPGLFPFPAVMHYSFAVVGFIFFLCMFIKHKKLHHLIFTAAIPLTLLLRFISEDNKFAFYLIGAVELLFLIAAFISSIVDSVRRSKEEAANTPAAPEKE